MRSRCLDTSLRLLLAALLLIGDFTLGIRHAHPGGNRAHHHNGLGHNGLGDNGLGHNGLGHNGLGHNGLGHNGLGHQDPGQHGLGHDDQAACCASDHGATASPLLGHSLGIHDHEDLASAPMHRHVFFLGFEFTLIGGAQTPDDAPEDGSQDATPAGGKEALLRLVADFLPNDSAVTFPVATAGDVAAVAAPAAILADRPSPRKGCMTAIARQLCDAARHERSGVLRS
jgi:hypothetical protein